MLHKPSRSASIIGATLLLLFAFDSIAVGETVKLNVPQPRADERVELLGIVFRLAGAPEYQVVSFREYDDAINRHFAPFKTHPVIQSVSPLRQRFGIAFDAVMRYALHISIENGRVVFPGEDSEKTLETLLADRWRLEEARLFAEQLDDFYVKSRFNEFFESQHEMYRKTGEKIKAINDKINYAWFKEFYGDADLERFHVIFSCINENRHYGPSVRFKDGHEEYFAIIGASGPDASYPEEMLIALIIHEFNHSFCNPLVEKYLDELMPVAERVFPFVAEAMVRQALGSAKTMLYEYLVRACEIRYLLAHDMEDKANRQIQSSRNNGFLWIAELVELLGRYEKERDKYPTLADFLPEIVKMQNAIVTDEYIAELRRLEEEREQNRPQIIAISPPNGATDVDPGITEIVVTFDRPMGPGMMWYRRGPPETYPRHSPAVWDDDQRTIRARNAVLEPGRTYEIWFNFGGFTVFRCVDNIPLMPFQYTFTTRAE